MSDVNNRTSKPIDPQKAVAERRADFIEHLITEWVVRRRAQDALTREELANLDSTQRIIAQKHSLLDNFAYFYRKNPCADVAPGCLLFVTVFADNNTGACMYSMERIAKFFSRSDRAIRDAMQRLEDDGVMYREKNGRSYACWPAVHRAFVSDRAHASWFVDALAPRDGKRPSGIGEIEHRRQGSGVAKQHRRPSAAIPEAAGDTTSLIDFPKENKQKSADQNFDEVRRGKLPESAQLTSVGMDYAVSQGMTEEEAQESFEEFSDHHIANGNLKNNWDRAWKQWVRNALQFGHVARKRGANQGAKGTAKGETAASAHSRANKIPLSIDGLLAELARRQNVPEHTLDWFRKLATMKPRFYEPIAESEAYLNTLKDKPVELLQWAADEAVKNCDWRPAVATLCKAINWKQGEHLRDYLSSFDWSGKAKTKVVSRY